MPQSASLVTTLKKELRGRKITYARVAGHLGLSETSVKRMFSLGKLSLERIDAICALMGLEFTDLARSVVAASTVISQLSHEQEEKFVADPKLMLVACAVLSHWNFEQIIEHYELSGAECVKLLTRLDKLKFVELYPNNRFKLLVSRTFSWLPDGPIQRQFREYAQLDYFRSKFDGENELMLMVFGTLSKPSRAALQVRLKKLAHEFSEMHNDDAPLPLSERKSMSLLLAARPWEPRYLRVLRRAQAVPRQAGPHGKR